MQRLINSNVGDAALQRQRINSEGQLERVRCHASARWRTMLNDPDDIWDRTDFHSEHFKLGPRPKSLQRDRSGDSVPGNSLNINPPIVRSSFHFPKPRGQVNCQIPTGPSPKMPRDRIRYHIVANANSLYLLWYRRLLSCRKLALSMKNNAWHQMFVNDMIAPIKSGRKRKRYADNDEVS